MNPRWLPALLLFHALSLPAQQTAIPEEVQTKLTQAQEFQLQQKYVDALTLLDEVDVQMPDLAASYNMRGSIYLTPQLRDFAKAQEYLDKAEALVPGEFVPKFNKAELLFVKHEWASAHVAFQKLLDDYPKMPLPLRHLTLYHLVICELKQEQRDAAEKIVKENFTFMDDTPAYYFAKAAIEFQQKKEAAAKDWLTRANAIYTPAESSSYLDGLMEARWVPNLGLPAIETKE